MRREYDERRALAHEQAGLIGFAYHDPKHFPKFEPSAWDAPAAGKEKKSSAADDARVRAFFIGLAQSRKPKE